MSYKKCIILVALIVGASIAGFKPERPASALADDLSYPWCTQGGELHCYYDSRQQCEEEVDYHGFCVNNPDYRAQDSGAPRTAYGRQQANSAAGRDNLIGMAVN